MDCVIPAALWGQVVEGVGNGLFSLVVIVLLLVFLDRRFKQKTES